MKPLRIVLTVIVMASLINFVRDGRTFHISQVLPLSGGHDPGIYDIGAFALIGLGIWGYGRLRKNCKDD